MTDPTPLPPWADPDSPDFDPLLAAGYPQLDPPAAPGPPRADWDGTVRLLEAAARACWPPGRRTSPPPPWSPAWG